MRKVTIFAKRLSVAPILFILSFSFLLNAIRVPLANATTPTTIAITSCSQLEALTDSDADANINLANNIDCHGVSASPLFTSGYSGAFNGQNHSISNLTISGDSQAGLFAYANDTSSFSNVTLINFSVTGSYDVGAMIGENHSTAINNVHALNVNVTGSSYAVGGLVGYSDGANSSNVSVTGTVNVPGDSGDGAGGIYGYFQNGTLQNCSFIGDVTTDYEAGGVTGENEAPVTISRCYSKGTVTATEAKAGGITSETESDGGSSTLSEVFSTATITAPNEAGGLVGLSDDSTTITNSFARGDVSAQTEAGGLVGTTYSNTTFTDSYSTGHVTDSNSSDPGDEFGGFLGFEDSSNTYNTNFWDTQTSGQADACGPDATCVGVFGKTTTHMKQQANYTTESDSPWNFSSIWYIKSTDNNGYPCLRWAASICADGDTDSISNAVENAGPHNGDANNDGTPDSSQADVTSTTGINDKYVVVQSNCDNNSSVTIGKEGSKPQDAAFDYPDGLVSFQLDGCTVGGTAHITMYFYGDYDASKFVLRKLQNGSYVTVSGAKLTNVTIGGQKVLKITYSITDGGALDADGVANGVIVDPAGPATAAGAPNTGFGAPQSGNNTLAIVSILSGSLLFAGLLLRKRFLN